MLIASLAAQRPRDALDVPAAVALLGVRQHASPEPLWVLAEDRDDAVDVDQVDADLVAAHAGGYSTVTDFARLRGWSTSVPRATATS